MAWQGLNPILDVGGRPCDPPHYQYHVTKISQRTSVDRNKLTKADYNRIVGTSSSPVGTHSGHYLTYHDRDGRVYVSWRGKENDQTIWWSLFDISVWTQQTAIPNAGTYNKPAIASFGGDLYLAWKGIDQDQRIWWIRHNTMPGQQILSDLPKVTNMSPALAPWYPPH